MCFATDEDDRTAEWVRPCRCRGSTKWVHQSCLQRWVDEKQRGNSTARVACPQCNAEYLIVFPKLGEFAHVQGYASARPCCLIASHVGGQGWVANLAARATVGFRCGRTDRVR